MIIVRISMQVLTEKQKEVMQTLLSLMVPMEKEAGCLSYALLSDIKDKNTLYVLEEWENRQKLENHLKSDLFGVLLGIKSLLHRPHGIRIYTVEKAEGMNAVLSARGKINNSDASKIKEIKQ
jgi:quinol monooxygenase YgiN